jgi:bacteriocin biosynthesis cyclodehydratase domain-containing protein
MKNPKLNENVEVGQDKEGQLHFILVNSRRHLTFKASALTLKLVAMMDGTRSVEQLAEEAETTLAGVESLCASMANAGLIVEASAPPGDTSGESGFAQFVRQVAFFQDFSPAPHAIQQRLAHSSVTILGLGAIGGGIATHLARCGVRVINAVDPDEVRISNVARHHFFTLDDIGVPKVEATERHLKSLNRTLVFRGVRSAISCEEDVLNVVEKADLVINCADNPSVATTSEWVGRACMRARISHILAGGYRTHLGFLGPSIIPDRTACWKCFAMDYEKNDPFARMGWKALEISRPNGGGIGALSTIVAAVHAWEAMRILTGILPPLMVNRKAEFDFVSFSISWREIKPEPACPECGGATRSEIAVRGTSI